MRRTLKAGDRAGARLVEDREASRRRFPLASSTVHGARGDGSRLRRRRTLDRWFADPEAVAFGAEIEGRIEAAHLGRSRGGWAELHLAGASDAGRALQAWLIRRAVEALRERGVRFVDIGGYGTLGDGLHLMKRRLGAREYPMRSVRQIYDGGAFAALCAEVGADPNETYFPPYRARAPAPVVGE